MGNIIFAKDVLQIRRRILLVRLVPCANHGRPSLNGDTSNQRSFFVRSVGICDIPSRIATLRNL